MATADPSPVAPGTEDPLEGGAALPAAPAGVDVAGALAACPVAAAGTDADGLLRWANMACRDLFPGLRAGLPLVDQCGFDRVGSNRLAAALAAPEGHAAAPIEGLEAGSGRFEARVQLAAGGERWLWLTPTTRPPGAETEIQRLHELLRMACNIGRMGVWERDLVTGQGHWDEQVFRTRGLEGCGPAPAFDDAAGGILASDFPAFEAAMRESLQPPSAQAQLPHWRIRYRIQGRDGIVRALHKQWFVQHAPDGRPLRMVGLVMDDSDALAVKRARDESVSQLALAADLTGLAVWRHDLASGRARLSPQAFAVFDLPPGPDDLPVELLRSLLHPTDRARAEQSLLATLEGGAAADDELRLRRRNGEWRTLVVRRAVQRDPSGRPQAVIGVAIDVTERIAASRRADGLGRRFQLAIDAAGIGHWTFDARTGTSHWSPSMRAMHGLPPDDPVPGLRAWVDAFVVPADRAAVRRRVLVWLGSRPAAGSRLDVDVRIRRHDGEVRELLGQVVVEDVGDDGGSLFGLMIDLTDRRLAEAGRRDRERALRESEAKSRFLSRMNHELRTPLNAVLGFAQLLLAEETGDDPASARRAERTAHIRSAGLHLLGLIDDALDLSSLEGGEAPLLRQPVGLAALVAETLPLIEPQCIARGVTVDTTGGVDGTVTADPMRLRQALLNLLSNAVKYNRRGGTVRVEARRLGPTTVLRVADTGRGMTPQQMRHLFEPFNRLGVEQEGIEGSGIGLTIVRSLTERMGGSVRVESEPGVGSVFELHLPTAPASAVASTESRPSARRAATARTVLYIEDEPVNAIIMTELLARRPDLVVQVAGDGATGLDWAQRLQPGLILLDMQLPDVAGLEVLARLRADPATAAIPVIGLSANAMRDDIDRARAAGIDGYWSKPIDHAAFLAALDTMFERDPAGALARAPR